MVTLGIDVMHINKRPFILSVSKQIKYFQCMGTRNKTVKTFMNTIGKMKSDYQLRGFKVKMIYVDRAFESCRTELSEQGIHLLCCDSKAHVHFVERGIRFVKENSMCPVNASKEDKKNTLAPNEGTNHFHHQYDQLNQKKRRSVSCDVTKTNYYW